MGLIYKLVDPRDELVRYIGCTKSPEDRFEEHLYAKCSNAEKRAWIGGLLQEGLVPRMEPIEEIRTTRMHRREQFWIAYYLFILDMPLVNRKPIGRMHMRHIAEIAQKAKEEAA